jgi:hypothetical protein
MYFEVRVSAIAKKLRATWPEVGEAGDVLFGRQGSCLVETDRGHAWLLLKRRDLFQRIELKARISRKRQVQCRSIAIVVAIVMSIVAGNAHGNAGHRLSAKAPFTRGDKVAI